MPEDSVPLPRPPVMPPPGWYQNPSDEQSVRWWDGTAWTDHVAVRDLPPPPIVEVRPWWRWLLYAPSVLFGGSVVLMLVGLLLWRSPRYRTVGRTTYFLSLASFLAVVLSLLFLAIFD
jgi:hypothetical protein